MDQMTYLLIDRLFYNAIEIRILKCTQFLSIMLNRILASIYGHTRSHYYRRRYSYFRQKYNIKSNFGFNGTDIRIYGDGAISLGNDSYIGSYSTIQLTPGQLVRIGDKCQISHNVRLYTSSADPDQNFTKEKTKSPQKGDIVIEDGVWIGANVFINPGVTIAKNTVIGANSVVTKDIPANCIYGGVPARLIRKKSGN